MSGHSSHSHNDFEGKLVCSAVSSAAYMAVNTLTEIVGASLGIEEKDALLNITVQNRVEECQVTLKGFKLHIEQLQKQYKNNIQIITEV